MIAADPERPATDAAAEPGAVEEFAFDDLWGRVVTAYRPQPLAAEIRRLIDPAAALETLHWGRNYLYRAELATAAGRLPVVVKQFRNQGLRGRLKRRLAGSKAERSFGAARALVAAGVATPEPLLVVESARPDGPSHYVCRDLGGVVEARYLLRAVAAGRERELFPAIDVEAFWTAVGDTLRRLHDAGLWHRDVTVGNVLIRRQEDGGLVLYLVDLNRTRFRKRLSTLARTRDLCRLPAVRAGHRELLLTSYWRGDPGRLRRALYRTASRGFELKNRLKRPLAAVRGLAGRLAPRRPHVHIPAAPPAASVRDRVVWDRLSDQPHQHAGRLEKLGVRLADARGHLESAAVIAASAPRIWRRYRELRRDLHRRPVAWGGLGVCLRPHAADPEGQFAAIDDLGARCLLIRLHPWQEDHRAEEELARELAARGYELAFSLPQNRDLVKEPARWRAAVEELAERFSPYGRHFQIGQAVNRSKWGVWRPEEYVELATAAGEILRRRRDARLLGPAVIDFELHAAATLLNLRRPGFRFDAVASLLYVDRRGAPERRQLGFDTEDKAVLLRAIAETARNSGPACWITEFNWPLWEGPHSPAGKRVAVDEETQADYLVRYCLITLATGLIERVYWWRLIARGYGLVDPGRGGLRRRPAFSALRTLLAELEGCRCEGPLPAAAGARLYRFRRSEDAEVVVGWSAAGPLAARLPRPPAAVVDRDGGRLPAGGETVELLGRPRYYHLVP